ncbi:thioredoxin-like protein [Xylariaceae sp. FL0255]|nr:thioredoxin-like protein [Xylariaceae sp. FL0255]
MSSTSSLKPIIVWGHLIGPNPIKVRMVLEELDIPFEFKLVEFPDMKKEPFLKLNPNGRVPAIEDPNTGLTMWESGPIIEYLIDQYDKDHKLSYGTFKEKYEIRQWIGFQISGQGPYYGQAVHFVAIHQLKLPTAVERYMNEVERVRSVLDLHLSRQAGEKQGKKAKEKEVWLVGNKFTVADLSFFIWEQIMDFAMTRHGNRIADGKYPHYEAWYKQIESRPSAQRAIETRNTGLARLMASGQIPNIGEDKKE